MTDPVAEDGTGVSGATVYATKDQADAYWALRPHDANAAIWAAKSGEPAKQWGALIDATSYLDATWGMLYRGYRATTVQGLLWPRLARSNLELEVNGEAITPADLVLLQAQTDTIIIGSDGLPLAALPTQILAATIELAARALSAPLAADVASTGSVKRLREKVGPVEEETEYFGAGVQDGSYGFVDRLLGPAIIGIRNSPWSWA